MALETQSTDTRVSKMFPTVPLAPNSFLDRVSQLSQRGQDVVVELHETQLDAIADGARLGDPSMFLIDIN